MDTLQFLSALFDSADQGYTQIFALPSTTARAVPVTDLVPVPAAIAAAGQQNIYFSAGICSEPKHAKWSESDIIGIPALWVDIDVYHPDAHKRTDLPQTIGDAISLLPDDIAPTFIVVSGYGIHAWWKLREGWYFDTPDEKRKAQELLTRMQAYIRQRASMQGWHLDSTMNIDRVMRLPGTLNYKISSQPVWSQVIHEDTDKTYNPSELDELIPIASEPDNPSSRERTTSFERRPTDGPAAYMLHNCNFMQHCQLNAKTLSYAEWLAALTNIVRAVDGVAAAHAVSAIDAERYKQSDCDKKIDECLGAMNPQNCDYIRRSIGFQGCPASGCGIQAPCGWSLGKVPQARALLKTLSAPTADEVYRPEILTAAAIVEKEAPAEYDMFWQRLTGQVNKNTFRKELAKHKREQSGFTVIDGGQTDNAPPVVDGEGAKWLQQIVQDVPLNLQIPSSSSNYAQWRFSATGVGLLRVSDKGETFSRAAYTPIVITERIHNIDSGTEKAKVMFKANNGTWRGVTLPKSTIFDSKKIMSLTDNGLTMDSEMAKTLSKWLSSLEAANAQLIPVRQGVSKMGWRSGDTEFILPGLDTKYTIDIGDSAAESTVSGLGVDGDFGVWIETMRSLRTRPKARFILAASFAAPLLKIIGQRNILIHNWGNTADGKTATLYAALSVWGNPDHTVKTFDDTKTNLEKSAELFNDLPLGINEYELLNDRKKGEVDPLIYMVAEGRGRGRGRKDGGVQKTAQWRTIALLTGESPISRTNSRGGVLTRLLEVHGGPLADDKAFASSLYWLTTRNHGHAGQWFITKLLQSDHAYIKESYDKTRYALRERHPNKLESHLDAIACVALADYLSSMWVFGDTKEIAGQHSIAIADMIIGEIIAKSDADDSERAWTWLQDWIASNEGRFTKSYEKYKSAAPILGYVDNGFMNIIKTELMNAMRLEGFSPEKVFRAWVERGRIPYSEFNGKRTFAVKGKTVNGVRPWVICIKMEE